MSAQWLDLALAGVRLIGRKFRRKIIKVRPYLADLIALEKIHGDQNLWGTVAAADAAGIEAMLTAEQIEQLAHFKRVWDKHLKKPLKKVSEAMDRESVSKVLGSLIEVE